MFIFWPATWGDGWWQDLRPHTVLTVFPEAPGEAAAQRPPTHLRRPRSGLNTGVGMFPGQPNRNLICSCRRAPTSRPRPSLQPGRARKPGRWGRREGPRARLGRSTAPARPPVAPARAALGLGGVFVGGRVRRGAASRLSLQGRVLGPGRGPARFRALSECASGGLGGGVHRRCPFPSVDLLRLHSRAAIYLEWVILACFPRAASRSPGVEH